MAVIAINSIPAPSPSKLTVSVQNIGSTGTRTASGMLVTDLVAKKRKLKLKWAHLTPAQLGDLLSRVAGEFTLEYPDPEGVRTSVFVNGDVSMGVLMVSSGVPVWTDVEMEWTER